MILQVGVKAFLKNSDEKYLLLKRNPETYPQAAGVWDIVGGRIEPGTTLLENLQREIREETGLTLASEPILLYAQDIRPTDDRHIVRLTYQAIASGEVILDPVEHLEYKWVSLIELAEEAELDIYAKEIVEKRFLSGDS